jgi:hypothetical protein
MKITILLLGVFTISSHALMAQGIVGKLKQKAEQAAENALDKKINEKTSGKNPDGTNQNTPNSDNPSTSRGRQSHKGGEGLNSTIPDVKENMSEAESAYAAKNYGEARRAIQLAMQGVELEIGNTVLQSLPEKVSGLSFDKAEDRVTSTGWGWVGLTIERVYFNDDKELRATIANNAAWMSAVNMYLTNGGYAQTTGGESNRKVTKVKNHRAIIEYDEGSGYKLSVPLGQSSLFILEGINFTKEQDVMNAANTFDIDGILKTLNEK